MPQISKQQEKFIEQLSEQLINEFNYISDVLSGRAPRRSTMLEKFFSAIDANQIGTALVAMGVAVPYILAIKGGVLLLGQGAGYLYSLSQFSTLSLLSNGYLDHTLKAREQLIKETAKDAAYIYEYAINELIDPKDIPTFARIGAVRIIEYLIRVGAPDLTEERLLAGLLQGKSGAGIEQLTNNDLHDKHGDLTLTVEDLYGRAAYRTHDGKLWANSDRNNLSSSVHLRGSFGWVTLDKEGMPRYGYRLATQEEVRAQNYTELAIIPGTQFEQRYTNYQSKVRWVDEADIKNYLAARRNDKPISFNDYLGAVARFCGVLEGVDLRHGDFSYSDFSDAEFIHCQLDHCNFSNAYLVRTQWIDTTATYINLSRSECAYLQAPYINFINANFNDANFHEANFDCANLAHMTRVGASWHNVKIYNTKSPVQHAPALYEDLAAQAFTQLKKPMSNAYYDAHLLHEWLKAKVQAVLTAELARQNLPESIRNSFALLARNDIHYLNGHQTITFTCALIIRNGLNAEDREKIDRILNHTPATTGLTRKEIHIARVLKETDVTLAQHMPIKMMIPALQSHLTLACERLKAECNLSVILDFSESRVLSINGWVYETTQNPSALDQISWQSAIFLGGNDEIYTQYTQEVGKQVQPDIRAILSTLASLQNLFIQDASNQRRQLDLQIYEKWQQSLYYLARYHHLEWQDRNNMLEQLASKKIIHKQLADDLRNIWWAWDNRHIRPVCAELFGFTAQIHTLWCQLLQETLNPAAAMSSELTPADYLLQDAKKNANWQAYCDYFVWRWTSVENNAAHDETLQKNKTTADEVLTEWGKFYISLYRSEKLTLMRSLEKLGHAHTQLFNHLLDVNDISGWHYGLIYRRQQWLMRWQNAITSSASDDVNLVTPQFDIEYPPTSAVQKHAMASHVKMHMLNGMANAYTFKNPFQKVNGVRDSLHAVYRFDYQGETYWAKLIPARPAIEFAINELMKRACGQSYLPETLISRLDIPGREAIAVQWSEHIGGVSLIPDELSDANMPTKFSPQSFFVHLVRTLITGPQDDSHKDFRVVEDKNGQQDLFRFDYDQSFYVQDPKVKAGHVLQIKSIVLCLDNMHQALDLNDPVIQRFLKISPLALLNDWLESLKAMHTQYQRLFERTFSKHFEKSWGLFTEEECNRLFPENNADHSLFGHLFGKTVLGKPSFSFLTVFLDDEVVIKINKLFAAIQSLLQYHQNNQLEITGMALALGVHHELGEYYDAIFQQVTYQENAGFSGLSTDVMQYIEKKFGRPIMQLPKALSPLLRFLERTHGEYNLRNGIISNQDDRAMASSVLHFTHPLTLMDAHKVREGKDRSPKQAMKALENIKSQNGFELLKHLKEDGAYSEIIAASIVQFNKLSARHRSTLLAREIEKLNDAVLRKVAIKRGLCYTPPPSAPQNPNLVHMPDDANCLFSAIAHQLRNDPNIPYAASRLRTKAVSYMKKNGSTVPIPLNANELKGAYFDRMNSPETRGGEAEIEALAKDLNKCIYVARANGIPSIYGDPTSDDIYLWDNGNGHYHSLDLLSPLAWQTRLLTQLIPGTILRSLDLSGFGDTLDDEHLRNMLTTKPEGYLLTTGAFIERLDLSHNTRITYAAIMLIAAHCPNIRELRINNSALQGFYYRVREINHFRTMPVIFPKLEILSLNACGNLSAISLQAPRLKFLDAAHCTNLKRLTVEKSLHGKANLTGCDQLPGQDYKQTLFFTSIDWSDLTPAIQTVLRAVCNKDYSPENLQLATINLTYMDIRATDSALRLGHIPEIFLGKNNLQDDSARQFFHACDGTPTRINFFGQLLGLSGFQQLLAIISSITVKITHLNLGLNYLKDHNAQGLAEVLKDNTFVISLDLAWNNITDVGARALCDVLRNNFTLLHLNLTGNAISAALLNQINLFLLRNQSKAGKLAKNQRNDVQGSPAVKAEATLANSNPVFDEALLSQAQTEPAYSGMLRRLKKRRVEVEHFPGMQMPEAIDALLATPVQGTEQAIELHQLYGGEFAGEKIVLSVANAEDESVGSASKNILQQLGYDNLSKARDQLDNQKSDLAIRQKYSAEVFTAFINNEIDHLKSDATKLTPKEEQWKKGSAQYLYCSAAWAQLRVKLTREHPQLIGLFDKDLLEKIPQQAEREQAERLYLALQEAKKTCEIYCTTITAFKCYIDNYCKEDALTPTMIKQLAEAKRIPICIWALPNETDPWMLQCIACPATGDKPRLHFLVDNQTVRLINVTPQTSPMQAVLREIRSEPRPLVVYEVVCARVLRYIYFSLYDVCMTRLDEAMLQQWLWQAYALLRIIQLAFPNGDAEHAQRLARLSASLRTAMLAPQAAQPYLTAIAEMLTIYRLYFNTSINTQQELSQHLLTYYSQQLLLRQQQKQNQADDQANQAYQQLHTKLQVDKSLLDKASVLQEATPEQILQQINANMVAIIRIVPQYQNSGYEEQANKSFLELIQGMIKALLPARLQSAADEFAGLKQCSPAYLQFLSRFLQSIAMQLTVYEYALENKYYFLLLEDPLLEANRARLQAYCPDNTTMAQISQDLMCAGASLGIDPKIQAQQLAQLKENIYALNAAVIEKEAGVNAQIFFDVCDLLLVAALEPHQLRLLQLLLSSPWQLPDKQTKEIILSHHGQSERLAIISTDLAHKDLAMRAEVQLTFSMSMALQHYHGMITSPWAKLTDWLRESSRLTERWEIMARMEYRDHHLGLLDQSSTAETIRTRLQEERNKVTHQSDHTWFHTESRMLSCIGPALDEERDQRPNDKKELVPLPGQASSSSSTGNQSLSNHTGHLIGENKM